MKSRHTVVGVFDVLGCSATLFDDTSTLGGLALLFLLQFLSGLLTQQQLYRERKRAVSAVRVLKKITRLTLSFFFLSGVMKPFLAFLALDASSMRLRTSARLASISVCFFFFSWRHRATLSALFAARSFAKSLASANSQVAKTMGAYCPLFFSFTKF